MRIPLLFSICAAAFVVLPGCADSSSGQARPRVELKVVSSPPEHVSGGNARIEATVPPEWQGRVAFWLNEQKIEPPMSRNGDRLEGIVSSLRDGKNLLEVRSRHDMVLGAIRLTNHAITGPMFSGPQQEPFICRTEESGLGQPLVDNQAGIGHPVFDTNHNLIGYSRYCSIPTGFHYFYYNGSGFKPFNPATDFAKPPRDLKTTPVNGIAAPFVVRVEAGTINRFLYTIAMLAPYPEQARLNNAAWNGKLVYWLRGGVGIGHQQGTAMWTNDGLYSAERLLMPRVLAQGFAVATSSGNETGVHYNLRLAEETAMMTKEHFVKAYGKPRFTIGLGGSGGAVQQYAFAQNRPGLIDGGIPVQSFPDMITQTIPISDCPLLDQYFHDEVGLDPASQWARWSKHRLIEGMNASDTARNAIYGTPGTTECINAWLTADPTVLNPRYKDPAYDLAAKVYHYPSNVFAAVKWTHWNDLANIYGTDSDGYAPISIDNVGVQYGLKALVDGQIGIEEFLRINACVGGWKEQPDFAQWDRDGDPFDSRDMKRGADCRVPSGTPAPRRKADLPSIRSAYTSGQVFTGRRLGIPMIDLRPYLEPQLNMHNSRQPFSVRARLLDANRAAAGEQVIWFTGSDSDLLPRVLDALSVMDRYLDTGTRPAEFADKCFDTNGALIGAGQSVWNGILDNKRPGVCTATYPIYSSPRMIAGESIKGDIFKCALKPVAKALRDGTYGRVHFSAQQTRWLERIFPTGVCDFSKGDMGRTIAW